MPNKFFTSLFCLIAGVAAGYLITGETTRMAAEPAQSFVSSPQDTATATPPQSAPKLGRCRLSATALAKIRQAVRVEMENMPTPTITTPPDSGRARPELPPGEQQELYELVEQRIFTHANSGRPLTEALAQDPDFQKLSSDQKLRIGQEIAARFNRGEISAQQLRGK